MNLVRIESLHTHLIKYIVFYPLNTSAQIHPWFIEWHFYIAKILTIKFRLRKKCKHFVKPMNFWYHFEEKMTEISLTNPPPRDVIDTDEMMIGEPTTRSRPKCRSSIISGNVRLRDKKNWPRWSYYVTCGLTAQRINMIVVIPLNLFYYYQC